ncbi:hypothetical protein EH223_12440 [candidate division KSB1 bacterium]|nr:hypothetical protein [candidate division KSB1 bacterium]RQW02481.1 MAG: hypothetical protein EH223_12440 [candidate division KSB1 bacterium]
MDRDLELLHQKIDFLTEQMVETQRRQRELEELWKDVTPVLTDLFNTAAEELDEISPYFGYEDLIHLVKKMLRNIRSLTVLFEQVEGAQDLVQDLVPLSKEIFDEVLGRLDALERKGYFRFMKATLGVVDDVVARYSEEDIQRLGDGIIAMVDIVKEFARPEMLASLQKAAATVRTVKVDIPARQSTCGLLRQMLDPDVRRLLGAGLGVLQQVAGGLPAPLSIQNENGKNN